MYKYLADVFCNGLKVEAYDACQGGTCTLVTEFDEAHQTFPITAKIDQIEDPRCLRSEALSQYLIKADHQHQPPPQHLHFFLGGLALSKALTYP